MSVKDYMSKEPVNAPIFPKPPVVLLLFIAAGFALRHFVPLANATSAAPLESIVAGCVIIACAVAIAALAVREMGRSRTAILPGAPAAALVQTGVFQRSRNPIYLSFAFFMVGLGIATANAWMIVLAPVLLLYLGERVVKHEQAYLTAKFGPDYIAYKRKVRRWL